MHRRMTSVGNGNVIELDCGFAHGSTTAHRMASQRQAITPLTTPSRTTEERAITED
jgi:hypothetical protein